MCKISMFYAVASHILKLVPFSPGSFNANIFFFGRANRFFNLKLMKLVKRSSFKVRVPFVTADKRDTSEEKMVVSTSQER